MNANKHLFGLVLLTAPISAHAVPINVSGVSFTSFAPNPIAPGQRPTSIGYIYDFANESGSTVSVAYSYTVTLSLNAILGDSDDFSLGTLSSGTHQILGFQSGRVTGTSFNVLGELAVSPSTQPGEYRAFLAIAPLSPHADPTPGDTIGQLPGIVTIRPHLAGDYNGNGVVDAADYTVWRDTLGSTTNLAANGSGNDQIDAGDYTVWKSQFGDTSGSGSGANLAVPEPKAWAMALLVLTGLIWRRSR